MKKFIYIFLIMGLSIFGINAYAKDISDGTYVIRNANDFNKVLDVAWGNASNSSNVWLYEYNGTDAQKWEVKDLGNGYYSITTVLNDNFVLDVAGAGYINGTNAQLYLANSTNAQQWLIKDAGAGYFYIISRCNGLYLDVAGGNANSGTNIQLYSGNGTNAQKFAFTEVLSGSKTIEDGYYKISTKINDNMLIDVAWGSTNNGANIQLYESNNTNAQIWYVKYLGDGYYSIASKKDLNKVLDVYGGSAIPGANVHLYMWNGTPAQKWIIKDAGDGYYHILTNLFNRYLDVAWGKAYNESNIQIYQGNDSNAQKFKFNMIDNTKIDNGVYTIESSINSFLTMNGDATIDRDVSFTSSNSSSTQKWFVVYNDDGTYYIKSGLNSNKYLALVENTLKVTSTPFSWQFEKNDNGFYIISNSKYLTLDGNNNMSLEEVGTNNQTFKFNVSTITNNERTYSDGKYIIRSTMDNSKVFDATGGHKYNGTNLQIYENNYTNAQVWYLKYLDNGYYSITSSMNPNVSIDIVNASTISGTNIQLYKLNHSTAQRWLLKDDGNGNVSFVSGINTCIDVSNGSSASGTNIQSSICTNNNNQKFKLTPYIEKQIYKGIDISAYQNDINWNSVGTSGVEFVIIRAGYGDNWTSQDDRRFKEYVAGCEAFNIPYGIYIYSYAENIDGLADLNADSKSASSEAKHALRLIDEIGADGYKPTLGTKVYIDMEEANNANLGSEKLTGIVTKFCTTVENSGYECGVYANKTWLTETDDNGNLTKLNATELAQKYEIWLAEWSWGDDVIGYDTAISAWFSGTKPTYNTTLYRLWQFTSHGQNNGITGNVDLDLGFDIFEG